MTSDARLPDFLIIGAMKSATTSLYRWLADQPEVFMAWPKEADFFSRDDLWRKGIESYAAMFTPATSDQLIGEASVSYSSPDRSAVAAPRMARTVPDARLVYVLRHPVERIRSHYRHEIQRGRERRPLLEALAEPGNGYLGNSRYFSCLEPYLRSFPREQICVVRFDDLVGDPAPGWRSVLTHLGLPDRPRPPTVHNVTEEKPQHRRAMLLLRRSGLLRAGLVAKLPPGMRRIGKRFVMRDDAGYRAQVEGALEPIPQGLTEPVWEDVARLETWLGLDRPLWERARDAA